MELALFFLLAGLVAVGIVSSLPVLVPPLHSRAQKSIASKALATLLCGLLAFFIIFILETRLSAELGRLSVALRDVAQSDQPPSEKTLIEQRIRNLSMNDIWLLETIPPGFRSICVFEPDGKCTVEDGKRYLILVGAGLFTGFISMTLAWTWLSNRRSTHLTG